MNKRRVPISMMVALSLFVAAPSLAKTKEQKRAANRGLGIQVLSRFPSY